MNQRWCRRGLVLAAVCVAASPLTATSWRPVGPWGGFVEQVVRCETHPDSLYALGGEGGAHRSIDGGRTWTAVNSNLPPFRGGARALVPDPSHVDLLWLSQESSLWHTRDGGRHWVPIALPAPGTRLLAVAPGSGDVLFAGGASGLFRSRDHGQTWRLLQRGLQPGYGVVALAVDVVDPQVAWASIRGPYYGVYTTRDGGGSWRRVLARKVQTLRADPHASGTVVGLDGSILLRSRDAGSSWTELVRDPGFIMSFAFAGGRPSRVLYVARRDIFDQVIAIDGATGAPARSGSPLPRGFSATDIESDAAGDILVGGFRGLVRSDDARATWSASDRGLAGAVTGPAVAILGLSSWIVGNERSTDGGAHWTRFLADQSVTALAVDPRDREVVYAGTGLATIDGTTDGVFKSTDGGRSWRASARGLRANAPTALVADPRDPDLLYFATAYDGLWQSRDAGGHWHRIGGSEIAGAERLVIPARGPRCLFISFGALRRSCDEGATWTSLLDLPPNSDIAVSNSDPSRLYAVEGYTSDGTPLRLWRSTDGGNSFTDLPLPISPAASLFTARLAIDERHPDTVYLGGTTDVLQGGVWSLTGAGPWREISQDLFDRDIRGLRYDGRPQPRLFLSTTSGVYLKQVE